MYSFGHQLPIEKLLHGRQYQDTENTVVNKTDQSLPLYWGQMSSPLISQIVSALTRSLLEMPNLRPHFTSMESEYPFKECPLGSLMHIQVEKV